MKCGGDTTTKSDQNANHFNFSMSNRKNINRSINGTAFFAPLPLSALYCCYLARFQSNSMWRIVCLWCANSQTRNRFWNVCLSFFFSSIALICFVWHKKNTVKKKRRGKVINETASIRRSKWMIEETSIISLRTVVIEVIQCC